MADSGAVTVYTATQTKFLLLQGFYKSCMSAQQAFSAKISLPWVGGKSKSFDVTTGPPLCLKNFVLGEHCPGTQPLTVA